MIFIVFNKERAKDTTADRLGKTAILLSIVHDRTKDKEPKL